MIKVGQHCKTVSHATCCCTDGSSPVGGVKRVENINSLKISLNALSPVKCAGCNVQRAYSRRWCHLTSIKYFMTQSFVVKHVKWHVHAFNTIHHVTGIHFMNRRVLNLWSGKARYATMSPATVCIVFASHWTQRKHKLRKQFLHNGFVGSSKYHKK